RESGHSGARPGGAAVVLAELATHISDGRGGALAEGALPRLRVKDDRLPLLRLAAVSPGRRAGALGAGLRRTPRVRTFRAVRRSPEDRAAVHELPRLESIGRGSGAERADALT